jgi:poly-beta-1,6-N-acetyl-D-glucosamine biosynthesis protein PgaD
VKPARCGSRDLLQRSVNSPHAPCVLALDLATEMGYTAPPTDDQPPATTMSGSLIIHARHRLRWHQRLLSDASTALLWSAWIWLWMPLVRAHASLAHLGARLSPALAKLHVLGSAEESLQYSVAALIGASGTLIVWNRLPGRRACAAPPPTLREYARHFDLPEGELRAGRDASVCVVHHDEHGRILRLERREPAGCAERLSA